MLDSKAGSTSANTSANTSAFFASMEHHQAAVAAAAAAWDQVRLHHGAGQYPPMTMQPG